MSKAAPSSLALALAGRFKPDICFSEDEIAAQHVRFAEPSGRTLPKYGKGPDARADGCSRCGKKSWPYALCRDHREGLQIKRALNNLIDEGVVERVTDGRGRKGGATYKITSHGIAMQQKRRKARTIVRAAPKIGRNDPCTCGSGLKFKRCHGGPAPGGASS